MTMNLGAVTPVYNEETLITGCIKSLENFVDEHIVLVSDCPYYGEPEPSDKTAEMAEELGANVITGYWPLDHMQRNVGIKLLEDYDWIICTDVDMWMTKKDMEALIGVLETTKLDAFVIPQTSYWKDTDHVISNDDFRPVIAVRPHVRFVHIGNIGTPFGVLDNCQVHHLAWCEPKNIYKKVTTYSHAPEFNGKIWYEAHYRNWTDNDRIAVLPNKSFEIKKQSLPDELKAYL